MLGSTYIHVESPSDLIGVSEEDLNAWPQVSLGRLQTLDFSVALQGSGIPWSEGEPLAHDPDAGWVVFKVNPAALKRVLAPDSPLCASHAEDVAALRAFIAEHGDQAIHEYSTF